MTIDTFTTVSSTVAAIAIVICGTAFLCAATVYTLVWGFGYAVKALALHAPIVRWIYKTRGGRLPWIVVAKGEVEESRLATWLGKAMAHVEPTLTVHHDRTCPCRQDRGTCTCWLGEAQAYLADRKPKASR